mgnify:CR=1 FL=1
MPSTEPRLALAAGGAEPPDDPPGSAQGLDLSRYEVYAFVRAALARGFATFEDINLVFPPAEVLWNPIDAIAAFLVEYDIVLEDR